MPRDITSKTTLENLKREAKRWLRALRENAGDAAHQARARLEQVLAHAPDAPTLRDVQRALALEHGFEGWASLKQRLTLGATPNPDAARADHARLVQHFLENACPDHHVRGTPAHVRARHTAVRLLERYPELAHDSFYTSVVCGDLDEVTDALAERSQISNERRGATRKGWEPILFLAFTRLPLAESNDNAVAIATALLDHGADPNVYFMAGHSRYTPLTGVIGEGEEDRPPHPRRNELVRLLMERGANPFDIQVLYNIHFQGQIQWYIELAYEYSVKSGRKAAWDDPDWMMFGMGGYGPGAFYCLSVAIRKNDLGLAEWILTHGGSPRTPVSYSHAKFRAGSLYEEAVRRGQTEMAELLATYGAERVPATLTGIELFSHAAFRLDRDAARAMVAEHPEYLRATQPIFAAAKRDRADVVELLLDLGTSPDVENEQHERPMHMAAYTNSLRVAERLIARGAVIDPVESNWGNTPLGAAVYAGHLETIDYLARFSRDLWELTYAGKIDRLREILRDDPGRAKTVSNDGHTPLMWLFPEEERVAIDIAKLLIDRGADPTAKNSDGQTAADRAEQLGMFQLAEMLRSAGGGAVPPGVPPQRTLDGYEEMAHALLDAYRTGTPEAMQRHWSLTWHRRNWQGMRTYVQLDLGRHYPPDASLEETDISLDDARFLVAREHGFESWSELVEHTGMPAGAGEMVAAKPVSLLAADENGQPRRAEGEGTRSWMTIVSRLARFIGINAEEQMTDAALERVAAAATPDVTILQLGGSKRLTDDGIRHLARMPQLEALDLAGTRVTDRGLEVLRQLPNLRGISLAWTHVTDAGVAHLSGCERLEKVDLSGTATGDGAIAVLAGKPLLRQLRTGNGVTDNGMSLFHQYPVFKTWQGGEPSMALLSYDGEPNMLVPRGPFTDRGIASLVGLDGLFGLNLDDAALSVTADGLEPLAELPNLGWLAFDADDEAMHYIAALPHLRFLGAQDTRAGDDGFVALSKSKSIEYIWGRRCYNLRSRGFAALANMPALRGLSVSCKNVGEDGLAALPTFPVLRELMPMDVEDEGYRFIGQCGDLERLILMYCRETTDRSTEHIAGLAKLKKYFASYNKITDRSLEILGKMPSLEEIELSSIPGITRAGLAALAGLPNLRELRLSGLRVSKQELPVFPSYVHVHYEL